MSVFSHSKFLQFTTALKIDTKELGRVRLGDHLMGTQRWVLNGITQSIEDGVRNIVVLKCYDPSMRVLTADLQWKPIGELHIGERLVSVDEHHGGSRGKSRLMRTAEVRAISVSRSLAYSIEMSNGVQLIATADHRHLCKKRGGTDSEWRTVAKLRPGDQIRAITDTWGAPDYEDGWMGGIIDGEGHIRMSGVSGSGVGISQAAGPVLDRIERYLSQRGYHPTVHIDDRLRGEPWTTGNNSKLGDKPVHRILVQRMNEMFRLVGQTRPSRIVGVPWWESRGLPGKKTGVTFHEVLSIEPLDERDMIDIETSTATFICEGFVSHNCRQAGISTLCLALDLYWVFKFPGLSGALATHDDPSRDGFRETLQLYYDGLPHEWRRERTKHNRNMFAFDNRSRLKYMVAGTVKKKSSGALGRSAALAFLHATEMSSWADDEGLASLRTSLAEHNENRLYLWESTARGFNLFYDMWEEAKKAVTQRAIFVSFWANEFYRARRESEIYRAYWGKNGRLTAAEKSWVRDVKHLYDVDIDPEQVAWYRWMIVEKGGDELLMQQEHPPTEHHAFLATGSQFFSARSISDAIKRTKHADPPEYLRIECKSEFYETEIVASTPRMATFKIWEYPSTNVRAQYVLGGDPRYGSDASHDTNSISVWRCYADRCIQVAQFADPDVPTYAFAWVLCLLAGYYEPCLVNLEINGPGQAVFDEMQKLKKKATLQLTAEDKKLWNVVRHIQNYLYKRVDQLSGVPNAFHTQTTYQSKDRYMNNFRDYFERGYAVPMDIELVNEMKGIVREAGAAPEASNRTHDDRVTSSALAVHAWSEHLLIKLAMLHITYAGSIQQAIQKEKAGDAVGNRMVQNYMQKIGYSR